MIYLIKIITKSIPSVIKKIMYLFKLPEKKETNPNKYWYSIINLRKGGKPLVVADHHKFNFHNGHLQHHHATTY